MVCTNKIVNKKKQKKRNKQILMCVGFGEDYFTFTVIVLVANV